MRGRCMVWYVAVSIVWQDAAAFMADAVSVSDELREGLAAEE